MRKQRTAPHVFETRKQIGKWWLTQWIQESRILSCQCFKAKSQPDLYWGTLKKLKNLYTSSTSVYLYFWRWVTGRWGQLKSVRQGKIYRGAVRALTLWLYTPTFLTRNPDYSLRRLNREYRDWGTPEMVEGTSTIQTRGLSEHVHSECQDH